VNVPVHKETQPVESFTVSFEKTDAGANLVINWDDVKTALPIALK
jgi:hypothetical protein